MTGQVANGVVVLNGNIQLPEGTVVSLTILGRETKLSNPSFPVVKSLTPGKVQLTNEMIDEILHEVESASS
jgi:hypothetical protein